MRRWSETLSIAASNILNSFFFMFKAVYLFNVDACSGAFSVSLPTHTARQTALSDNLAKHMSKRDESNCSPFNVQYRICLHFFRKCQFSVHEYTISTNQTFRVRFELNAETNENELIYFSFLFLQMCVFFRFSFLSTNGKFTDTFTNDVRYKQASVGSFET